MLATYEPFAPWWPGSRGLIILGAFADSRFVSRRHCGPAADWWNGSRDSRGGGLDYAAHRPYINATVTMPSIKCSVSATITPPVVSAWRWYRDERPRDAEQVVGEREPADMRRLLRFRQRVPTRPTERMSAS